MGWTLIAYWVCFLTGTTFALVSALMSGLFGFGHEADAGGAFEVSHDYGAQGDAIGGHGEAFSVEAQVEAPIAPLSPATISVFMATFGGVGIILTSLFDLSLLITLPASAFSGFVIAAGVFTVFYHLFTRVQASSEVRMSHALGARGEVTVPISAEGVGEVALVIRGSRISVPARSQDGVAIARHAAVRIVRQLGSTLYVSPAPVEEDRPSTHEAGNSDLRD